MFVRGLSTRPRKTPVVVIVLVGGGGVGTAAAAAPPGGVGPRFMLTTQCLIGKWMGSWLRGSQRVVCVI